MLEPKYRGAMCHGVLDAYEADVVHAERLFALIDPAAVRSIRSASKLAWIPADPLDHINGAYLGLVGRGGYLEFWARYTTGSVTDSMFSALFRGALRIFGPQPRGLTKWISRAWDVTTRDYGRVEVEDHDDHVDVRVSELPRAHRHVSIALSMQASLIALIELTEHSAGLSCTLDELESEGRYEISARWAPRGAAVVFE